MGDWLWHLEKGQEALKEGEARVAETHFMAAHEKNPEDPVVLYAYARALVRREKWGDAEPLLRQAYTQDPTLVDAACEWTRVRAILGADLEQCLDQLEVLERASPQEYLIPLTKMELYLRSGDELQCRSALESARNRGAGEAFLQSAQAKIEQLAGLKFAQKGELQQALERFRLAARLDPTWGAPLVNQGTALLRMGEKKCAEEAFLAGLKLDPHNPVGLYNLATLLFDQGEVGQAAHAVKQLLLSHPDYPGARELAEAILKTV